tara:strand:+ start:247 stop:444 length:198 start_codon:yes stop_codon:yes gene_type:complete
MSDLAKEDFYSLPWYHFISHQEYNEIRDEFKYYKKLQSKFSWKFKKFLSENIITKHFFCCLKVED